MKTILIAWELGGGLGHLMQLMPLAEQLAQRGYRVWAALRDLSRARGVFSRAVNLLQAPVKTAPTRRPIDPPMTFAHILHNMGFEEDNELAGAAEAWRNLYRLTSPDLIIFDHAPLALLAARGLPAKRVLIGSGFCVPPDASPLPNLRPWKEADPQRLLADEQLVLHRINRLLETWGQPPLQRITQLYGEVDETLLVTFKELDHYPERSGAQYWGAWSEGGGKAPQWPSASGRRIYAYLKVVPNLPAILGLLKRLGQPTIVLLDGVVPGAQERYGSPTLRIEMQRLDLARIGRECDLAILNANHGTTAALLMAGKPILQLPIYLEQGLMARIVAGRLGAGLDASHKDLKQVEARLAAMLRTDQYAEAAERFAMRYAGFDPASQKQRILRRLEELLTA